MLVIYNHEQHAGAREWWGGGSWQTHRSDDFELVVKISFLDLRVTNQQRKDSWNLWLLYSGVALTNSSHPTNLNKWAI